jgi:hypothetical protein
MSNVTMEDLGHGVGYAYGPNGMTAWVVLDGRKWGKTYKGETAWSDAERDAFDLVMRRGR